MIQVSEKMTREQTPLNDCDLTIMGQFCTLKHLHKLSNVCIKMMLIPKPGLV